MTATAGRRNRLVAAQAHCSLLGLLGAGLLVVASVRLRRIPGADQVWWWLMLAAALVAGAGALAPWLAERFTVWWQRLWLWGALGVATVGVVGATWEVEMLAYLALQLLLAAGVLAELGTQRQALLWLWVVCVVLVAIFAGYHAIVDVGPRPE